MKYAAGFLCPHCGARTLVLDSRRRDDGIFHRRRACTECGLRFSTGEAIVKPIYTARTQDASETREADSPSSTRQDQNSAPVTRGRASE